MSQIANSEYRALLSDITERIRSGQTAALKAVNRELIALYWDIGRMIVQRQQGDTWGRSIVEMLARDLQAEFPGIQGFSTPNLWRMRDFYRAYCDDAKLSPLVREIGWTHNIIILTQCKNDLEREFYLRMTHKFGWSKSVLIHKVHDKGTAVLRRQRNCLPVAKPFPHERNLQLPLRSPFVKIISNRLSASAVFAGVTRRDE